MPPPSHRFFATAAKGTEGAVRDELRAMGLKRVRAERGGVWFEGPFVAGMTACLWSRMAMRILLHLAEAPAVGQEGLYEAVGAVPWEEFLTRNSTFAVDATVKDSQVTHSKYAALRTKDAIADRLTRLFGSRPDVDPRDPDVQVVLHLAKDVAMLSLDLSGEPLHRRGWRVEATEAPLKETLAAAMLALGGYDPEQPLCDPMCGSGTIVIEAALIARKIAPGRGRHFGFHRWPTFSDDDVERFKLLQEEARELQLPEAPAPIIGRDRFGDALEVAKRNADRAGVLGSIQFSQKDIRELKPLPERCQLFFNPPYGERIGGKRLQLEGLFRQAHDAWAALPGEHRLVALAGTPLFERAFPEKSTVRHTLFNGPLETKLLAYEQPAGRK